MAKTMKTAEVIELIKQNKPVEDIVLSDIKKARVNFRDALLLVENGFAIAPENILYRDSDIAHDADFDETEWEENFTNLKELLAARGVKKNNEHEQISIELEIKDEEIKQWLLENTDKLKTVVNKLIIDLYHTDKLLHSK